MRARQTVSVVIPTHNRSELLCRALDSVCAQTRPADQVIVVDDGSTDDTVAIVNQRFPSVTLITQPQAGVSAARNRGIARASGRWVAFLDSDDEWRPTKLERQLAELARCEHPPRLCHTDELWIRRGRRVNPMNKHRKHGGHIFVRCLPLCVISPSSAMIARELFDELGAFDTELPACEDYDMWLRICAREPVLFVDEPLVVKHGGHDDQLSRSIWGLDRFRIRALEKLLGDAEDAPTLDPEARGAALGELRRKISIYLAGAHKRGRTREVERYQRKRERWEHAE